MSAPLIITPAVRADLQDLRIRAALAPVDIPKLVEDLKTPAGYIAHMQHMSTQTTIIPGPFAFVVTFTIETGQKVGTCRHLSVSIDREGRIPSSDAAWMIAQELGFTGTLLACQWWPEKTASGRTAVNLLQPVSMDAEYSDVGHG